MRNLTTKQASKYLGVSVPTLARWRKNGTTPPYFKIKRIIRYRQDKLDEWVNAHTES